MFGPIVIVIEYSTAVSSWEIHHPLWPKWQRNQTFVAARDPKKLRALCIKQSPSSFLDLNSDPSSDKVVFELPPKEFHEFQNKVKKNEVVILCDLEFRNCLKKIVDYFLPILIIKRIVFLKPIVPEMDFSFYWITTKCANIHLWNSTLIIFYIHINHPFVSNFICTRSTLFSWIVQFRILTFLLKILLIEVKSGFWLWFFKNHPNLEMTV